MVTTIQVSEDLLQELKQRKIFDRESYEEVIWDLIEDAKEFSAETKKDVAEARAQIKAGKFYTHQQVRELADV